MPGAFVAPRTLRMRSGAGSGWRRPSSSVGAGRYTMARQPSALPNRSSSETLATRASSPCSWNPATSAALRGPSPDTHRIMLGLLSPSRKHRSGLGQGDRGTRLLAGGHGQIVVEIGALAPPLTPRRAWLGDG